MSKTNLYLTIMFFAQIGLGALTWTTCESTPEDTGEKELLAFASNDVTALEITEKPYKETDPVKKIALTKKDDNWVVSSAGDYPADKEKVDKVLDKLVSLKAGEPIATNAANHNALKVGDKDYGRKVSLKTKSGDKSLVIGDGPGQSVHVRTDGKPEVYRARGLSVWTLSTSLSSYLDTKYVEVDKDKLNSVTVTNKKGTLSFTKEGDNWMLAELPPGKKLDQDKVKTFIGEVAKLTFNKPVGKDKKSEHGLDSGTTVRISYTEDDETKTLTYTIGAKKDDSYFYAKADNNDFVVTVSKWSTDEAREKAAEDFVQAREHKDEK